MIFLEVTVSSAFATSIIAPEIQINWKDRDYSTTAPQPFGLVRVKIKTASNGLIELFNIKTGLGETNIDKSLYSALKNPSEPEITYLDPKRSKSGAVEYIEIIFEVGDPYRIDLGDDIPGCAPPCPHVDRDMVSFKVYRDLSIKRIYTRWGDAFENK